MTVPIQITFRNVKSSSMVEDWIRAEAAKLETFYNQIMGCRVAVEVPHRHHKKGKPIHVRIDLTLPGKEIVIKREPVPGHRQWPAGEDELLIQKQSSSPHHDLHLVIHDAFKAAGRRIQDFARTRRGSVKTHEPTPTASVSRIFPDEGYGFLEAEDGREIYFHKQSVLRNGFRRLKVGNSVNFAEEPGEKGPQATMVKPKSAKST
jgi:cold shock CspA family protein